MECFIGSNEPQHLYVGINYLTIYTLENLVAANSLRPSGAYMRRETNHHWFRWLFDGLLFIWPFGTSFSEILIETHIFLITKMHFKRSSAKWRSFCLGLNVLNEAGISIILLKNKQKNKLKKQANDIAVLWFFVNVTPDFNESMYIINQGYHWHW